MCGGKARTCASSAVVGKKKSHQKNYSVIRDHMHVSLLVSQNSRGSWFFRQWRLGESLTQGLSFFLLW